MADGEVTTFEATADLLEGNGIATHALRVVFYLDENGDEVYSFAHEGEANLSSWLGALELLREDIISAFRGKRVEIEED